MLVRLRAESLYGRGPPLLQPSDTPETDSLLEQDGKITTGLLAQGIVGTIQSWSSDASRKVGFANRARFEAIHFSSWAIESLIWEEAANVENPAI